MATFSPAPAPAANVSTGPAGRRRSGRKVTSSASTEETRSPVMKLVRSIQWVPMSPTERSAPPSPASRRQFQSVGLASQSWW